MSQPGLSIDQWAGYLMMLFGIEKNFPGVESLQRKMRRRKVTGVKLLARTEASATSHHSYSGAALGLTANAIVYYVSYRNWRGKLTGDIFTETVTFGSLYTDVSDRVRKTLTDRSEEFRKAWPEASIIVLGV